MPPKELIILDQEGQRLQGQVGPLDEHSDLLLLCQADGGQPPPTVHWQLQPPAASLVGAADHPAGGASVGGQAARLSPPTGDLQASATGDLQVDSAPAEPQLSQQLQTLPSGLVRSTLQLRSLNRSSQLLHVQCVAQNTPLLPPLVQPVTIELNRE